MIKDSANTCGLTNRVNGNIIGSDPLLSLLADNGGSTQTMALQSAIKRDKIDHRQLQADFR